MLKERLKPVDDTRGEILAEIEATERAEAASPYRWRAMLPGAAGLAAFSRVGHSLSAILAGMAGALLSATLYRRVNRPAGPEVPGVGVADPAGGTPARSAAAPAT